MLQLEKKVKFMLKKRKLSIDELSSEIGMSKQNLYNLFKTDDIKVSYIKKMSSFLDIPIAYFISEDDDGSNLPAVVVGKEQASPPLAIDVGAEVIKLKKALHRERKERKAREEQLLSIIAQQAKH